MERVPCFSEQTVLLLRELFAQRSPCAHRPACASFRDFLSAFSPLLKFFTVPISRYTEKAWEDCAFLGDSESHRRQRGDMDYIQPFFWPHRLSSQPDSSQASENISFTRGGLQGLEGVLAQAVPLQEHDVSFPPMPSLPSCWLLLTPTESLPIFSFFQ